MHDIAVPKARFQEPLEVRSGHKRIGLPNVFFCDFSFKSSVWFSFNIDRIERCETRDSTSTVVARTAPPPYVAAGMIVGIRLYDGLKRNTSPEL